MVALQAEQLLRVSIEREESMVRKGVYIAVTMLALGSPAAATVYCDVNKTKDGFVALRSSPSPKGKLVARMRVGDEVQPDDTVPRKNGWAFYTWWQGGRFKGSGPAYDPSNGRGWAYERFIGECG
jgi:hypothetical protein